MEIVLDANIVVSGLFWPGNPSIIIRRIEDETDTLFISNEIIEEINDVFRKPRFDLREKEIQRAMTRVREMGTRVTVSERVTTGGSRDKTDNKYLECAVAANADYVISGDTHLLELKEYRGIKIVKAAEYLQIAGGRKSL